MITKFKVASYRETDREFDSTPMYLTNKGVQIGKQRKGREWVYEIVDTQGKIWKLLHQKTRVKLSEGKDVLCTVLQDRIHQIFNLVDFTLRTGKEINRQEEVIKTAQAEIERLKAL